MSKFKYDDIVVVKGDAPEEYRPGEKAWVVGVLENPVGKYFDKFPEGVVYSVEFEEGDFCDIHESLLNPYLSQIS